MSTWSVFVNLPLHLKQQWPETHPCGSYGMESKKKHHFFWHCPNWGGGPLPELIFTFSKTFQKWKPPNLILTLFDFDTFVKVKKIAQIASRGGGEILGIDKKKECFFWDPFPKFRTIFLLVCIFSLGPNLFLHRYLLLGVNLFFFIYFSLLLPMFNNKCQAYNTLFWNIAS